MTPRVVFFGNSGSSFSNRHFRALTESSCDIVAVVDTSSARRNSTNPQQEGAAFTHVARKRNVPVFEPHNPNNEEFIASMEALRPDLFIAIGYVHLLKPHLLSVPNITAVNFHASLLPAYRGKHPVFRTLRNGERWAGLTVHVMDPHLDTGEILYQVRVRTRRRDSVATLYDRIMDKSERLVSRFVVDAPRSRLEHTAQGREGASYFSSVTEEDFRLDWFADAEQSRRWICTSPGQCFSDTAGRRFYYLDAEIETGHSDKPPGTVLRVGRTNCLVATGRQALVLRKARLVAGEPTSMARLCRELNINEGDRIAETN